MARHSAGASTRRGTVAAGVVRHLLSALRAELTMLHVGAREAEADDATALNSVLQTGLTNELRQVKTRRVVHLEPAEGILDAAASGEFDLVALIAQPRSFWSDLFERSVTAQVLLNSETGARAAGPLGQAFGQESAR